jgi:hypothetical protein
MITGKGSRNRPTIFFSAKRRSMLPAFPGPLHEMHVGQDQADHGLEHRHDARDGADVVAPAHADGRLRPSVVTVRCSLLIEGMGLTAARTTRGCPLEMPPRMPPALFERNPWEVMGSLFRAAQDTGGR